MTNPEYLPVLNIVDMADLILISDVKVFIAALEAVAALKKQVALIFSGNEIRVSTVDDQHVMLIHFCFKHEGLSIEKKRSITVDLKNLCNILKMSSKLGKISIKLGAETDGIEVIAGDSSFKVPELTGNRVDDEYEPQTQCSENVQIVMISKEAKNIFKELVGFGGDINFCFEETTGKKHIICEGKGGIAKVDLATGCSAVKSVLFNKMTSINQKFDAKYIHKLTKLDTLSKEVILSMVNDMPLEIRYQLTSTKDSFLSFFLAPKTL